MADIEIVDAANGVVLRRIVVGELHTNCWAVHGIDDRSTLLVDPGDQPATVLDAVADLDVVAIVATHTHWDHVLALPTVTDALDAPVLVHAADAPIWPGELAHLAAHGHFDAGTATGELLACGCTLALPPGTDPWDGVAHRSVRHGQRLRVGGLSIELRHTPGHTPGGVSIVLPGHVLTGDTLFPGGPGLTGWPFSDFPTIITSIERELLSLPLATVVHPGHGRDTTIGAEVPQLSAWKSRGW
jgi:glyoxylase-like metal-dependent hydrolase (beta-lactamase superfamily II)